METTTTFPDIDPKDIGKHIFDAGWYEGEISRLEITTVTEGDQFGAPGDRSLRLVALLDAAGGKQQFAERFQFPGAGAWKCAMVSKGLGLKGNADLTGYHGVKVRMEFKDPRRADDGRSFNSLARIALADA